MAIPYTVMARKLQGTGEQGTQVIHKIKMGTKSS